MVQAIKNSQRADETPESLVRGLERQVPRKSQNSLAAVPIWNREPFSLQKEFNGRSKMSLTRRELDQIQKSKGMFLANIDKGVSPKLRLLVYVLDLKSMTDTWQIYPKTWEPASWKSKMKFLASKLVMATQSLVYMMETLREFTLGAWMTTGNLQENSIDFLISQTSRFQWSRKVSSSCLWGQSLPRAR